MLVSLVHRLPYTQTGHRKCRKGKQLFRKKTEVVGEVAAKKPLDGFLQEVIDGLVGDYWYGDWYVARVIVCHYLGCIWSVCLFRPYQNGNLWWYYYRMADLAGKET